MSHIYQPLKDVPTQEDRMTCENCNRRVLSSDYDAHVAQHIRQQHMEEVQAALEVAKEDKGGVTISGRVGIDFGILDTDKSVETVITILSTESSVLLRSCAMESSNRRDEHGTKWVLSHLSIN